MVQLVRLDLPDLKELLGRKDRLVQRVLKDLRVQLDLLDLRAQQDHKDLKVQQDRLVHLVQMVRLVRPELWDRLDLLGHKDLKV
tara:strand:- start:299 stop:550 length:252 start_codon:yes stop_codon:yes gene_type:complete